MRRRRMGTRIIKKNARVVRQKQYITNAKDIKKFTGRKILVTNTNQMNINSPGHLNPQDPDPAMVDYCRAWGQNDPACAIELVPYYHTGGGTTGGGTTGDDDCDPTIEDCPPPGRDGR